jgi:Arc/MetJ-type ribon-helix-helix transcriptional regulator
MDVVTVKMDKGMKKDVEKAMKENHYATKTDFIREAIRDKLKTISREEALKNLDKYFGASKTRVTDEEYERARHEVFQKYIKEFKLE